jgi:hypothetical protein
MKLDFASFCIRRSIPSVGSSFLTLEMDFALQAGWTISSAIELIVIQIWDLFPQRLIRSFAHAFVYS